MLCDRFLTIVDHECIKRYGVVALVRAGLLLDRELAIACLAVVFERVDDDVTDIAGERVGQNVLFTDCCKQFPGGSKGSFLLSRLCMIRLCNNRWILGLNTEPASE